ncbi:MAG: hypothetical protein RR521_05335, partial [Clostridia bacterium]
DPIDVNDVLYQLSQQTILLLAVPLAIIRHIRIKGGSVAVNIPIALPTKPTNHASTTKIILSYVASFVNRSI